MSKLAEVEILVSREGYRITRGESLSVPAALAAELIKKGLAKATTKKAATTRKAK